MMYNIKQEYKTFFTAGLIMALAMLLISCAPEPPSSEVIEKAKLETRTIMDSLRNDSTKIIGEVNLESEFFDDNDGKYVLNYEVETGVDSAHIITSDATAYISKENETWLYRLVFDRAYIRPLEKVTVK
jgi:hypothetical protein